MMGQIILYNTIMYIQAKSNVSWCINIFFHLLPHYPSGKGSESA